MQLTHIKEQFCPGCGAKMSGQTQDRLHTNGMWNESRTFDCGAKLEFSPNFRRTDMARECPKTPDAMAKLAARKQAKADTLLHINSLACDDDFKAVLAYNIKNVYI